MSKLDLAKPLQPQLLAAEGPVCLILTAQLRPVGDTDRFQPAGFPEVGHVIYDAPRVDHDGTKLKEKVCIVDSPASMANHLETVCLAGAGTTDLHPDLKGLPHVVCVTDSEFETKDGQIIPKPNSPKNAAVVSTFTEGHRLASDYFLDAKKVVGGQPGAKTFREELRDAFKIIEVKKDKTYFIPPGTWWSIFTTIFQFDPNSLIHGVMFAKEQIKISRLLTAHMEAFGANRVGRSGVKFDRLQKTTSGQPIFAVDEETAQAIRSTFVIDLAMLRSYGRGKSGLNDAQKSLLLDLAIWKISQLLRRPFRYRTQCFLRCQRVSVCTENETLDSPLATSDDIEKGFAPALPAVSMADSVKACGFPPDAMTSVYYPANELFKAGKADDKDASDGAATEEEPGEDNE
jgi:CRISPR-associated protein Csb1